jgi:hypothetical protein
VAEPTVPVPVSLIEDVDAVLSDAQHHDDCTHSRNLARCTCAIGVARRSLRALLSQSTPTGEPDWPKQTTQPGVTEEEVMRRIDRSVGKSPSIADMVPGTTFVTEGQRFMRIQTASGLGWAPTLVSEGGMFAGADDIDPSTIRDVTPPVGS